MNRSELLERVRSITPWTSGGQRAPHKPLLLLLAVARVQRGEPRLASFTAIEEPLRRLLMEFGPPRKSYHPEYPFWFLVNDRLWEVHGEGLPEAGRGSGVGVSVLRGDVRGGFPADVQDLLMSDPTVVSIVVRMILDEHFAPSLHGDLLAAVGTTSDGLLDAPARRDPNFRIEVLRAYEYRCAMCGFDGQLDTMSIGVDAAHVRWWAHRGPDDLSNGIALCALHHRAFDGGAMSIGLDRRIMVTRLFRGGQRARTLVLDLHGREVAGPQAGLDRPETAHLQWHHREVFKGPPRLIAAAEEGRPYADVDR